MTRSLPDQTGRRRHCSLNLSSCLFVLRSTYASVTKLVNMFWKQMNRIWSNWHKRSLRQEHVYGQL